MLPALFTLLLLLAGSVASNTTSHRTRSSQLQAQASRLLDNVSRLSKEVKRLQTLLNKKQQCAAAGTKPLPPLKRSPSGIANISDCLDVKLRGLKAGSYFLEPLAQNVVCTHTGEMVVLARESKSLDCDRRWEEFKEGFGEVDLNKEFFIGLDAMHKYTSPGDKCMSLSLRPIIDSVPSRKVQLTRFMIGPESLKFTLSFDKEDDAMTQKIFAHQRGHPFATKDQVDPRKCAINSLSANWFNHCYSNNLFGRYNHTKAPHYGFSSSGMSKSSPTTHYRLRSAFMTLRQVGGDPQALKTVLSYSSPPPCPARVAEWTVPETSEYLITAGGAPGGNAPHVNAPSGGRGALVKIRVLLKKGTKLRFVRGCSGGVGHLSGGGGDGTFVADMTLRKLLVAAGGGGGGGWTSGGPGQSSKDGEKARLSPGVTNSIRTVAAGGWSSLQVKVFGAINGIASSGGRTLSDDWPQARGAGGGGGFEGGRGALDGGLVGERQTSQHSAGGGGGSFCNDELAESCVVKAGGNEKPNSVLKIEAYSCF